MSDSIDYDYKLYELAFFDDLITERLNPDYRSESIDTSFIVKCTEQLKTEKKILVRKMICKTVSFNDDTKSRCYICGRQLRIINLIDDTTVYLKQEQDVHLCELLQQIEIVLTDVLFFLSKNFSQYFDFSQKIPIIVREKTLNQFKKRLTYLFETVNGQGHPIFQLPINAFQTISQKKEISFYTVNYLNQLLDMLEKFDFNQSTWVEDLTRNLLNLNFNSFSFTLYLADKIQAKLSEEETLGQKRHLLLTYMKQYNGTDKTELPLNPNAESIWNQMLCWITEEMELLEQTDGTTQDAINVKQLKINTSMSVPQLSLFTRLQIEEGMILQEKLKVLRGVASLYSTPKAQDISFGSLRLHYYTFDTGTKEAVKNYLISMLNRLNHKL